MNGTGTPQSGTTAMGSKIWLLVQKAVPLLLVALVSFLAVDRNRAWDAVRTNAHALDLQRLQIDVLREKVVSVNGSMAQCQANMQAVLVELAGLPPDEWERRILQNTQDITELKGKLHK